MSERSVVPLALAAIVVGLGGAALVGTLAWNAARDKGAVVTTAPAVAVQADPTPSQNQPGAEAPSADQGEVESEPTAEPQVVIESRGSFEFDDAVLQQAITEGAANPLVGLPSRDHIATALLGAELAEAGLDLADLELTVYPEGAIPSFVLLTSSELSPLLAADAEAADAAASDDEFGELFLTELLDSETLSAFGVEKLIVQHSGTDELGPFVFTMTIRLDDLRAATEGVDVFDRLAVQMERP